MKHYVYLIISQNRLVITSVKMSNEAYHFMFSSEGHFSLVSCKTFCAGCLMGSATGIKLVNTIEEFQ
jgi:hypothetical protein